MQVTSDSAAASQPGAKQSAEYLMLPVILLSLAGVYKQLIRHFAFHKALCCIWLQNNHNYCTWYQ